MRTERFESICLLEQHGKLTSITEIYTRCVSNTLTRRCGKNGKQQTRTHTLWKMFEMVECRRRYCCRLRRRRYHPIYADVLVIIFLHVFLRTVR